MTLTHSLEAFIGKIDFDQIVQHKVSGSMFGSPSSTAAYLMNASAWDDEAEDYLRQVIRKSVGQGSGGVPGVYPTTHFEYTWVSTFSLPLPRYFHALNAGISCPHHFEPVSS